MSISTTSIFETGAEALLKHEKWLEQERMRFIIYRRVQIDREPENDEVYHFKSIHRNERRMEIVTDLVGNS